MATCIDHASAAGRAMHAGAPSLILLGALVVLSGCSPEVDSTTPQPRPVRTVTIEQRAAGATVTLTGRIEAEDEAVDVRVVLAAMGLGVHRAAGGWRGDEHRDGCRGYFPGDGVQGSARQPAETHPARQ